MPPPLLRARPRAEAATAAAAAVQAAAAAVQAAAAAASSVARRPFIEGPAGYKGSHVDPSPAVFTPSFHDVEFLLLSLTFSGISDFVISLLTFLNFGLCKIIICRSYSII